MNMSGEQFKEFSEEMKKNKEGGGKYLGTNCIQVGGDDGVILNVSLYDEPKKASAIEIVQNSILTSAQKVLVSIGTLAFIGLSLFPPTIVSWGSKRFMGAPWERVFLFAYRDTPPSIGLSIDWSELMLQWIVVIVVTLLLVFLFPDIKRAMTAAFQKRNRKITIPAIAVVILSIILFLFYGGSQSFNSKAAESMEKDNQNNVKTSNPAKKRTLTKEEEKLMMNSLESYRKKWDKEEPKKPKIEYKVID